MDFRDNDSSAFSNYFNAYVKYVSSVSLKEILQMMTCLCLFFILFRAKRHLKQRATDLYYMHVALLLAQKCSSVDTAYNVGCILVHGRKIISTGYSRELEGNTHAEECALQKVKNDEDFANITLKNVVMYTTMEPCSLRLSKKESCVDKCINAGYISRIVVGMHEPTAFVEKCEGVEKLEHAGVIVDVLDDDFAEKVLEVNAHVLKKKQ
jgi:pyrimidine deaminase RibD-like protein